MKKILILTSALALFLMPLFVAGADLDDLKATDQAGRKLNFSLNPNDTAAYLRIFHKDFINFGIETAYPTTATSEQLRQGKADSIAMMESTSFTDNYADYRVVGNTGIVSLLGTQVTNPKDGPAVTRNVRYTLVYVKTGGNWQLLTAHGSVIPAGN